MAGPSLSQMWWGQEGGGSRRHHNVDLFGAHTVIARHAHTFSAPTHTGGCMRKIPAFILPCAILWQRGEDYVSSTSSDESRIRWTDFSAGDGCHSGSRLPEARPRECCTLSYPQKLVSTVRWSWESAHGT